MKFFAIVALLGTTASIRLGNINGHQLVQRVRVQKLHNQFAKKRTQRLLKAKWDDLSAAQMEEIGAWFEDELTTGEETITWSELKDAVTSFGQAHDFPPLTEDDWAGVKDVFNAIDTNNDGAWDLDELVAAWEAMQEE